MDFTQLPDADLLQELIDANHAALRGFLFLCAIEDELDRKQGTKPQPYEPEPSCYVCKKPWHLATPTGFSDGTTFAGMTTHELMVQHSNARHSGGDEYALRVELECQRRGLIP